MIVFNLDIVVEIMYDVISLSSELAVVVLVVVVVDDDESNVLINDIRDVTCCLSLSS